MRTVKEISDLTGISVRALHYYDEIGLLKPTQKSEAGYRLYDDKALETLRQILFFREFDISLKQIKMVLEDPQFDQNQILWMQRKMLAAKKERMERLIASIDRILKGEKTMDFEVFSRSELESMYDSMAKNMSEEQKAIFIEHYGSMEAWREEFLKNASSEPVQKNFQKIVEWYGSKEKALEVSKNPDNPKLMLTYQKRLGAVMEKLAGKKGCDVDAFEVRELVGEYDFVARQMYQINDATALMLEIASAYQKDSDIQAAQDHTYGEGATKFIGQAIEAFYKRG